MWKLNFIKDNYYHLYIQVHMSTVFSIDACDGISELLYYLKTENNHMNLVKEFEKYDYLHDYYLNVSLYACNQGCFVILSIDGYDQIYTAKYIKDVLDEVIEDKYVLDFIQAFSYKHYNELYNELSNRSTVRSIPDLLDICNIWCFYPLQNIGSDKFNIDLYDEEATLTDKQYEQLIPYIDDYNYLVKHNFAHWVKTASK